jgi:hypothetical protein
MGTITFNLIDHPTLRRTDYISLFKNSVSKVGRIPRSHFGNRKSDRDYVKDGYSNHSYGNVNERFIMLSTTPYDPSYLPQARITTHQSHYDNAIEMLDIFQSIWGDEFTDYLVNVCTIHRIDFWRDIKSSYHDVSRTIYRENGQWSREMYSKNFSYTFGRLKNNTYQFIAYRKEFNKEDYTRLEGRFTGTRCPIKHYCELRHLVKDFTPFPSIQFIHYSKKRLGSTKLFTKPQKKNLKQFERFYRQYGYLSARRELNKNGNFKETIYNKTIKDGLKRYDATNGWREYTFKPFIEGLDGKLSLYQRAGQERNIAKREAEMR